MFSALVEFLRSAVVEQIIKDPVWATAGLVGQAVFGGRFLLQWLASEYKKQSHVPTSFWYMSLVGGLIMLVYSIHIKNPIFILAFVLNSFIYLRNLHLIYKHNKKAAVILGENGQ